MIKLTKNQIMSWTKGENSFHNYNKEVSRVVTDSRKVDTGDCYIAIKGENFDGNDFVDQAIDNGAIVVISDKKIDRQEVITVKNTTLALGKLAKAYLHQFNIKKLAVTGSSGKTTTKDMLYYAFAEHYNTHRNDGNFNNEIGMPLTALNIDEKYEAAIFEMGMSSLGEIDYLAQIVRPNIAIITNIGTCHIELLKSQDNIFKAKMEITNYMTKEDYLIVNGDDKFLSKLKDEDFEFNIIKTGFTIGSDLRAINYHTFGETSKFTAEGLGIKQDFIIPAIGKHNVSNALNVIATCLISNVSIEEIQAGLMKFEPSKLRMQIIQENGIKYINDSYNANPESMEAVLSSFESYASGRKIGILGDMLELGEFSKSAHEKIGYIANEALDIAFFIGGQMKYAYDAFGEEKNNDIRKYHFIDKNLAITEIKNIINSGDTVLFKGSRGMKLDELLASLIENESMEG